MAAGGTFYHVVTSVMESDFSSGRFTRTNDCSCLSGAGPPDLCCDEWEQEFEGFQRMTLRLFRDNPSTGKSRIKPKRRRCHSDSRLRKMAGKRPITSLLVAVKWQRR